MRAARLAVLAMLEALQAVVRVRLPGGYRFGCGVLMLVLTSAVLSRCCCFVMWLLAGRMRWGLAQLVALLCGSCCGFYRWGLGFVLGNGGACC
jgi:hypothetical protein